MLITLDPVGEGALVYIGSSIYYRKPKPKANFWINIRTTPDEENRDQSDGVADFGEQWEVSEGPDINSKIKTSHGRAGEMFKSKIANGKSAMDYLYESVKNNLK